MASACSAANSPFCLDKRRSRLAIYALGGSAIPSASAISVERCPCGSAHFNAAKPRKPPSLAASATRRLTLKSQDLNAAAWAGSLLVENRRRLPQGDKRVLNEVSRILHLAKALVQRLVELALPFPRSQARR